jgi:hypothetical protein
VTDRSITLASALIFMGMIGTLVALSLDLPYQFTGSGRAEDIAGDAIVKGTAISPPITLLVAAIVATALAARDGTLRRVGLIGLVVVGAIVAVGSLGELPGSDAFEGGERIFVVLWDVAGAILAIALAYTSARALSDGSPNLGA